MASNGMTNHDLPHTASAFLFYESSGISPLFLAVIGMLYTVWLLMSSVITVLPLYSLQIVNIISDPQNTVRKWYWHDFSGDFHSLNRAGFHGMRISSGSQNHSLGSGTTKLLAGTCLQPTKGNCTWVSLKAGRMLTFPFAKSCKWTHLLLLKGQRLKNIHLF